MANQTRQNGEQGFFALARQLFALILEQCTNYSFEAYLSFMHGAIWHILAMESWAHCDVYSFGDRLCSELSGKGKVYYDCWHGIGHGLAHLEAIQTRRLSYSTSVQIRQHGFDMGAASLNRAVFRCVQQLNLTDTPLIGCVHGVFHSYFNYLPRTHSRWETHCDPFLVDVVRNSCLLFAFNFGVIPGAPISLMTLDMQSRWAWWGHGPVSYACDVAHWSRDGGMLEMCKRVDRGLTKYSRDLQERMPMNGLGICSRKSAYGDALVTTISHYLRRGGRLIDTAQVCANRVEVGIAVAKSRLPRDYIWITDKIKFSPTARCRTSSTDFGRFLACDQVVKSHVDAIRAVEESLLQLNTTYVDLVLVHHQHDKTDAERVAVWRGSIEARAQGMTHHIGVSNFRREQILALINTTGVRPAVSQVEFHPWVSVETRTLVRWCHSNGIAVTAYGSLRGLSEPVVSNLSSKYGVSLADILLKWALQQGVAVIPSAMSTAYISWAYLHRQEFNITASDVQVLERSQPHFQTGNLLGEKHRTWLYSS